MKLVTILEMEISLFLVAEVKVLKIHFFPYTIEAWYSLDPTIINSKSLEVFKSKLLQGSFISYISDGMSAI